MLLCYVIDSGLSTSLLLLATLIIMFYILHYITVTTSTIVKRRWHVLRMLSGAIPSTWALAFSF